MRRREFIAVLGGATVMWPMLARGQRAIPVIGFVSPKGSSDDADLTAFRRGLNEAGYSDGRNVVIDVERLNGKFDRAPAVVADLISRQVNIIVATTPGAVAAKAATSAIPIVFATGGDPVKLGLVPSLNRPGGNITGVTFLGPLMESKRVELLHELVSNAEVIAVLLDPTGPLADIQSGEVEQATSALGIKLHIQLAGTDDDFHDAFAAIQRAGASALLVGAGPLFDAKHEQIIAQGTHYRLPTMYGRREFVEAGGLMSYGTTLADSFRQIGIYVGQILKGTKPSDLPVLQTAKFEFVINLKTAKALGLTVPPQLLARADEVFE